MKATAETFWVDEDAHISHRASTVAFKKWFNKLRHLLLQSVLGVWDTFVLSQQQKAELDEQSVKDEFFFDHDPINSNNVNWKNIPRKTWNRHSAFLVHRQLVDSLQKTATVETSAEILPTTNTLSVAETRISFHVTSIRPLPVWATALTEMSMVESDLSSLRLMELRTIQNITAKAA